MKRWKISILFAGLCLFSALALAATPEPVEGSAQAPVAPSATGDGGICLDTTPALCEDAAPLSQDCESEDALDSSAAPGGSTWERKPKCSACPQQPWCECTYNGHPRISCDPCCYQSYAGPICTSLPADDLGDHLAICRLIPECSANADCDAECGGAGLGRCGHSRCPVRVCRCK